MISLKNKATLLEQHVEDRYVVRQKHPTLDLWVYNYAAKAQFENYWNDITTFTRGLILDQQYNLIGRGFAKFFNYEQVVDQIPVNVPYKIYNKYDGSFIGVTKYQGQLLIWSRGSFTSPQATNARLIFDKLYSPDSIEEGKTFCFEVIYPQNRIVVNYGNTETLVLLAVMDNNDLTVEHSVDKYIDKFQIVESYDISTPIDQLRATLNDDSKEGVVLHYTNGFRVKIKFDEYCRLHKILNGINEGWVWDNLRNNKSSLENLSNIPDEFYRWIEKTEQTLKSKYLELKRKHETTFAEIYPSHLKDKSRKEQAFQILQVSQQSGLIAGVLFNLLDNKDYQDVLWKNIKPQGPGNEVVKAIDFDG